jgi:hypothetical protein
MTENARNWFFNAENFVYWMSPTGVEWSRNWVPEDPNALPFISQLSLAFLLGTLSSYIGLWFGAWMVRVRR